MLFQPSVLAHFGVRREISQVQSNLNRVSSRGRKNLVVIARIIVTVCDEGS